MSVADAGDGERTNLRSQSAALARQAHLLPLLVEVHARTVEEVGGLIGHCGEEFIYVLSGTLRLHVEGRPVRTLRAGASALFDSAMPHAYLAGSAAGCKMLLVVLRAYGAFKDGGRCRKGSRSRIGHALNEHHPQSARTAPNTPDAHTPAAASP